jgi:hypothetical protein
MGLFRRLLVALGVLALAAGIAVAVEPALAAYLTASRALVYLPAVLLALFAVGAIQRRRQTPTEAAETGDPEDRVEFDRPGAAVDRALALGRVGPRTRAAPQTTTLRERIRPVAIAEISRRENCSREAAARALEEGTWTDDPVAASYFAPGIGVGQAEWAPSFLRPFVADEPSQAERARRAIAELAPLGRTVDLGDAGPGPESGPDTDGGADGAEGIQSGGDAESDQESAPERGAEDDERRAGTGSASGGGAGGGSESGSPPGESTGEVNPQ